MLRALRARLRRGSAGVDRRAVAGLLAVVIAMVACIAVTRGYRGDPLPGPTPSEPVCDQRGAAPRRLPPSTPAPRVIASGLCAPSAIAFLPDGSALVAERNTTRVLLVTRGGDVREVQRLAEPVVAGGGLLGIAVSPAFAVDSWIYAYHTTSADNRIVRFHIGGVPEPVLTGIPAGPVGNGGRIAFGPDGMLYAGTGDAGRRDIAQDPSSLGGKVLRITPDGRPAPGNPNPRSPVWSLGHRDVRGLAWDGDGRLYAVDAGRDGAGELHVIAPGGNYARPRAGGAGSIGPVATWAEPASAGGAAVLAGTVYVACLDGERLRRFRPGGRPDAPLLLEQYGRLSDVAVAPDRTLWILTSNRDDRGIPAAEDDRILALNLADVNGA
jgi:glucose/arabinose dehydrogenase